VLRPTLCAVLCLDYPNLSALRPYFPKAFLEKSNVEHLFQKRMYGDSKPKNFHFRVLAFRRASCKVRAESDWQGGED
jgi:hypothetical protein